MSVSMFPQLAAQRLVALRLWRKREPRINRTYDQTPILRLVSSQRFHFHLIPPGFERAFAISKLVSVPSRLNRWLTVLCAVSIRKHRLSWQPDFPARFSTVPSIVFIFVERRHEAPPLLLSLFHGFSFRSVDVISFLSFFCSIFLLYIYSSRRIYILCGAWSLRDRVCRAFDTN